jgi:hypothetical protein
VTVITFLAVTARNPFIKQNTLLPVLNITVIFFQKKTGAAPSKAQQQRSINFLLSKMEEQTQH